VNVTTPYISLIVSRFGNLTDNTELGADLVFKTRREEVHFSQE